MKRFLLVAMAIVFAMHVSAQETTYAVGEYGTTTSYFVPANTFYNYSYTQSIYPADSLQPGLITAISYKYAYSSPVTITPSTIYMAEVSRSAFASSTDYEPLANLTQVFSGSVTYSQGWVRIELNQPFNYTGEGNLLEAYVNDNGSYATSSYVFNTFPITSGSIDYHWDDNPISPSNPYADYNYSRDYVPSIKFHVWPEGIEYCYSPENFTVSNIASTSADLSWTANTESTSSEYGVAYKTESSEEWIELGTVSGENTSLSDLEPFTRYDVKVWTICSNDVTSAAAITNFCTNPDENMIQTLPYY